MMHEEKLGLPEIGSEKGSLAVGSSYQTWTILFHSETRLLGREAVSEPREL